MEKIMQSCDLVLNVLKNFVLLFKFFVKGLCMFFFLFVHEFCVLCVSCFVCEICNFFGVYVCALSLRYFDAVFG